MDGEGYAELEAGKGMTDTWEVELKLFFRYVSD